MMGGRTIEEGIIVILHLPANFSRFGAETFGRGYRQGSTVDLYEIGWLIDGIKRFVL